MNIVVPVKLVPDLVEELTIDDSGTALDTEWLRMIINEFDDHAIEQAVARHRSINPAANHAAAAIAIYDLNRQ